MKSLLVILMVVLLISTCAGPVLASDSESSDSSSSDSSSDDSPDSSDDSVDDSPDSSDDSSSGEDLSEEIRSIRDSTNEREIELERELSQYSGEQLAQMSDDKNLRIAVYTIRQAGAISGAGIAAPQLASIADEINRLADDSLQQEDRIRERSDVIRFLVGGDRNAAASLDRDADNLQIHITQLEQLLSSQDLDDEIKPVLQDQLQVLVQERDHLRDTASREREDTGLFGGIFGS